MRRIGYAVLSLLSLSLCLVFPILRFLDRLPVERFKVGLLFGSFAWFIFASLWAAERKEDKKN
jgi:hypothetical protein